MLNTGEIASSQNRNITRKTELFGQRSLSNYFSNQEKKLKPEAAIVYKNPPTLATKLTNYKKLSQILPNTDNRGSYPCGKCALRGNFKNYKNMVKTADSIISDSNNKKFNLKQHLTCKNYGIYVAECKFCKMQYV